MPITHKTITTYTSEGMTFEVSKRLEPLEADWWLEIKWANDENAIEGELIKITKHTAQELAALFQAVSNE